MCIKKMGVRKGGLLCVASLAAFLCSSSNISAANDSPKEVMPVMEIIGRPVFSFGLGCLVQKTVSVVAPLFLGDTLGAGCSFVVGSLAAKGAFDYWDSSKVTIYTTSFAREIMKQIEESKYAGFLF